MQVLFVLRFSNSDKTDKIDRLILRFNYGRKDEQWSQTADVCIKIVSSYRWQYSLFWDPQ